MRLLFPPIAVALALASSSRARAALPPGYEDVMWCPAGYCDRPRDPGMVGPARIFHECYDPATASVVDEVWTGDESEAVAPAGWVADPPACPAEEMPTPPGFVTTPGCEDQCAGVEEGAEGCDASAFEGCQCVFSDPYCFSECEGGEWMTACAGSGGGDLPPVDEEPPPALSATPPAFATTPECEDKCAGVEEGAEGCDASAFEGCQCVFSDPYCFSECEGGEWLTACADAWELPPPPPKEEAPPASPPPLPEDGGKPLGTPSPGFATTPGCEDKCAGVEEGAEGCDDAAFQGCQCVFSDPYCFSECEGGEWLTACAGRDGGGDVPPPSSQDAAGAPPTNATNTTGPQDPVTSAPTQQPSGNADVDGGDEFSAARTSSSLGIAAEVALVAVTLCFL